MLCIEYKIKQLTKELNSLSCRDSKYNLRSTQILWEIRQLLKK